MRLPSPLASLAFGAALAAASALPALASGAQDAPVVKVYHLYTSDGQLTFADGNATYVVGYTNWDDDFGPAPQPMTDEVKAKLSKRLSVPGPTFRVKVGERIKIVLHHAGHPHASADSAIKSAPHTIHFHGLDLVQAMDGVPDLPIAGVEEGASYVYDFAPEYEGTYVYHCHVDSAHHILLGMYGAFIVEGRKPNRIYGYKYDREYTLLMSEMDTKHNQGMKTEGNYDLLDWKSNYWLMNGRIFVSDLTNPLSTINDPRTRIVAHPGETVLLRLIAVGNNHVFALHPHGYHFLVVGTDGRRLPYAYEKDTLPMSSGERYDVLVKIREENRGVCPSCNMGRGISIMHDHNMRGVASDGKYPQGGLTIFDIK